MPRGAFAVARRSDGAISGHATSDGEYEFGPSENETIGGLSSAMRFVGIVFAVIAVLFGLGGVLVFLTGNIVSGGAILLVTVAYGGMGARLMGAATSMRSVVDTEGNDINNLMAAFGDMRSFYVTSAIMSGIGIAGAVLGHLAGTH
ncbi:MAG: hypothetical protein WCJ30_22585 [Deltaproteobacteria bacterium]